MHKSGQPKHGTVICTTHTAPRRRACKHVCKSWNLTRCTITDMFAHTSWSLINCPITEQHTKHRGGGRANISSVTVQVIRSSTCSSTDLVHRYTCINTHCVHRYTTDTPPRRSWCGQGYPCLRARGIRRSDWSSTFMYTFVYIYR